MAIRPIVKYGHPVLHSSAQPVESIDARIVALLEDMFDTVYAAPGIGLAAPQIGVPLRVMVIDLSVGEDPSQRIALINPQIIERGGEQRQQEGCLSVPGFEAAPIRPQSVKIRGLAPDGGERTLTGTELLARALCHEMDHLDGLLFVDRLSPLKRDLLRRRLRKRMRDPGWDA